jgi:hypothetical protein
MVIANNGANNQSVVGTGTVPFQFSVASGQPYAITVATQPTIPVQSCQVTSGTGTVTNANVTGITIACTTTNFTVSGTITNLAGTGMVLQNNLANNQTITGTGTVPFQFTVPSEQPYAITVLTPPSGPDQHCSVANGTGTVSNGNVSGVAITCANGYVLNFAGGIVLIPPSADFNDRTTYTLEGWINKPADNGGYMGLLSQDNGGCCIHRMLIDPSDHPFLNAGQHVDIIFTGTTFTLGQWTHFAMTCGGGTATAWVAGQSAGTTACADPGDMSGASIYLGAGEGGGPYRLTGKIAEVRISNVVRYTTAFTPQKRFTTDANTMGLYHFDEGSGSTVSDSSGKGHNGQIQGIVNWVGDDR